MFRAYTRLDYDTFNFLISIVAPSLQKRNTHMWNCISVVKCVALFLIRLGSGNSLINCRELFGILDSNTSIILRDYYHGMKVHLMPLAIP
jgi:hypothetical protein